MPMGRRDTSVTFGDLFFHVILSHPNGKTFGCTKMGPALISDKVINVLVVFECSVVHLGQGFLQFTVIFSQDLQCSLGFFLLVQSINLTPNPRSISLSFLSFFYSCVLWVRCVEAVVLRETQRPDAFLWFSHWSVSIERSSVRPGTGPCPLAFQPYWPGATLPGSSGALRISKCLAYQYSSEERPSAWRT